MTQNKAIKTIPTTQSIMVKLTKDEIQERAVRATALLSDYNQLDDEFVGIKKNYQRQLKEIEKSISDSADAHRTGREWQKVQCNQVFDMKAKKTWFIYNDQEYDRRDMSQSEVELMSQRPLFSDKGDPEKLDDGDDEKHVHNVADIKARSMNHPTLPKGPIGKVRAVDPEIKAVMKSETNKKEKKDHVSE